MFYSRFLHLRSEKISLAGPKIWAHFLVKCYETITFRQRKWSNYSKCFRCAFHMHSTVSLKGQPSVGPFFYSPRMSHAYHASTPTHTLTYPTTYHYDPILGKADCPVHLRACYSPVTTRHDRGVFPAVSPEHNGATQPRVSGEALPRKSSLV